jgi:hypothetical protein
VGVVVVHFDVINSLAALGYATADAFEVMLRTNLLPVSFFYVTFFRVWALTSLPFVALCLGGLVGRLEFGGQRRVPDRRPPNGMRLRRADAGAWTI